MASREDTLTPAEAARWTRAGVLGALAIVLGYLETFVPIPIPGVKLGLANVAVLIALAEGDGGTAVAVALVKVLAAGILFGSPVTMAYSAVGTALSLVVMVPLSHLRSLHVAMLSVAGAVAHEAGQLLVAQTLLGTTLVWYSAPPLLVAGILTGALCGAVAARTLSLATGDKGNGAIPDKPVAEGETGDKNDGAATVTPSTKVAVVAFLAFAVAVLRASDLRVLCVFLVLAACGCIAEHVGARGMAQALRPIALILAITLVAQVASQQQGEVLATLGPVAITREALLAAARMSLRLLALAAASSAVAAATRPDEVTGVARWLLSPLSALGANIEGPLLALSVALSLVPVLARKIEIRMGGDVRILDRSLWTDVIPGVVADLLA